MADANLTLDTLTDDQIEILDELVHDVASQTGSNVINSGEQAEFLLSNGHQPTGDEDLDDLDENVHDLASQTGSNVINSGEQIEFLLSNGWHRDDIRQHLGIDN